MSTTDFLRGLDLGQLEFARDEVLRLIKQKQEAGYVTVWQVSQYEVAFGYFAEADYSKAITALAKRGKELIGRTDLPSYGKTLKLSTQRIPADELQEYLDHG